MTQVTYADLSGIKGMTPKLLRFFSGLFSDTQSAGQRADAAAAAAGGAAAATGAIQNATVLTLSPNAAFTNERVLQLDPTYFTVTDTGANGQFVIGFIPPVAPGPYADDAAAATGGVAVGSIYRKTGGDVVWRQV